MSKSSEPTRAPQLDGAHLAITELSAEGSDEWVTVENLGTVAQPLTGWVLATLRGDRLFHFPEGTFLQPGQKLRIHSGSGAAGGSAADLLWTREPMWNDKGDTAVLFGANGHEVSRLSNGRSRAENRGARLLYREDGPPRIEESAPEKMIGRDYGAPSLES